MLKTDSDSSLSKEMALSASTAGRSWARRAGSLAEHWREYLIEAAGLGVFMISACTFGVLLEHPASPVRQAIEDATARRVLAGLAMGLTAVGIVYSPWGKRSGAHFNPAVTLTFHRLGKIDTRDAVFYAAAQFAGGVLGVLVCAWVFGELLAHPTVNFVATLPGPDGAALAFAAEVLISMLLMTVLLTVSNQERWNRFTGLFAGVLIATYISVEGPVSGMSMNPARTLASALPGGIWMSLWVYFLAPPIGMLLAGELYRRRQRKVLCAKLHHENEQPCIFRCGHGKASS